ncbi:L-asparaginase II [Micromonospora sp. ATCC 39149]|uniref:Asparaginase n=1 Tax=Micromonospora carbonacea TaxID=47853 RepID=A0A7D5YEG3_9ACTN|nr:asparaginase [Micromonospora sp. ATCC 39149]EEP71942.1 L-asparaginase II [Micromonospora sp. ATCC 39149]QLJ98155.1 asparaginase [Micromonospora carbonacea]
MSKTYEGGVPLVEVVRSGFVEGLHRGSVVVLDAAGAVVAGAGDGTSPIFPRSASKPMQAVGMLRAGLPLTDPADVAIVSASHAGEEFHLARVHALLAGAGLDESDLGCPPDLPMGELARQAVLRAGGGPTRGRMNCSGKHAGMLLTCLVTGWPRAGYWQPEHPLQRVLRAAVEECTGEPVAAVGVDGCGAPVLAVSLTGLARAYLRLVAAGPGSPERTVADAMRGYPELVGGTWAEDSRLMRGLPGAIAKIGAEGVIAAALPGVGAVALKIDDGASRARMPVLVSALRRLGVRAPVLDEYAELPLLGGGVPVGTVRPVW